MRRSRREKTVTRRSREIRLWHGSFPEISLDICAAAVYLISMATLQDLPELRINLVINAHVAQNIEWAAACEENILFVQDLDAEIADMNAPILAAKGRECYLLEVDRSKARALRDDLRNQCFALQRRYRESCFALQGQRRPALSCFESVARNQGGGRSLTLDSWPSPPTTSE